EAPIENITPEEDTAQTNASCSLDSDDVSSLSSASNSVAVEVLQRPSTAPIPPNCNNTNTGQQQRSRTVSATSRSNSLSSASPVMGSVVGLARQKYRRKHHMANAWASSDSTSYTPTSSNNSTRPPSSISSNDSLDCVSHAIGK
ncbi:hypothetical protein DOY81_011079, partial [Sarcophaga bullata]